MDGFFHAAASPGEPAAWRCGHTELLQTLLQDCPARADGDRREPLLSSTLAISERDARVTLAHVMWLLKLLQMSSFKFSEFKATVDTFSPLPGNASFLRRGRSGVARIKSFTAELVKFVGNKMQNL